MAQGESRAWSADHVPALLSAGVVFGVALRLLMVGGLDRDTALAVLAASGTADVVAGALVDLAPFVLVTGTGALALHSLRQRPGPYFARGESWAVAVAAMFCVLWVPWVYLAAAVAFGGAGWILCRLGESVLFGHMAVSGLAAAGILLFMAVPPSYPAEAIVVDGDAPFHGYVLSADERETLVLRARPREDVRLATDSVERAFCHPPRNEVFTWNPFAESFTGGRRPLPGCPSD
jgi:hypothetical protein